MTTSLSPRTGQLRPVNNDVSPRPWSHDCNEVRPGETGRVSPLYAASVDSPAAQPNATTIVLSAQCSSIVPCAILPGSIQYEVADASFFVSRLCQRPDCHCLLGRFDRVARFNGL